MGRHHPRGRAQARLKVSRVRLPSGVELHYFERGSGTPLVLLHGGTGDLTSWEPQVPEFARRYRVISYSRRYSHPNGNADVTPAYSAYADAEDLSGLFRHLRLDRVRLVGTSYGALTALVLAVSRPGCVHSMVLAEPPLHRWVEPQVYRQFMERVWRPAAQAFLRRHTRQAMRTLVDGMWGRPVFDRLPPATVAIMMRNARAMKALTTSADPFPYLPKHEVRRLLAPVLLIAGEHAAPIHQLANRALAGVLQNVRQETIAGASHGSPRENPKAFNRAVLRFLEN
jgi:non-heme chloroperoxidase